MMTSAQPSSPHPALDNVITLHPRWAAAVLCGEKTIEVRKAPPPSYCSGFYGIAVSGVPDMIVGTIQITSWEGPLTLEALGARESSTRVPASLLALYLGPSRAGHAWLLESPRAFCKGTPYWSYGQTTKGAPRKRGQEEVEHRICREPCLEGPDAAALSSLFATWKKEQERTRAVRARLKAEFYEARRATPARTHS